MPDWISAWVAKIFGSEPVVKVMYVLIVWAIFVFISPEAVVNTISVKTKIPFSGQFCLFAFAFVVVDASHRLLKRWDARQQLIGEQTRKSEEISVKKQAISEEFERLDSDEKNKIKRFVELGENTLWFFIDDVVVTSLSQKKFIDCAHNKRLADGRTQMTYRVNERYTAFAKEYFSNDKLS